PTERQRGVLAAFRQLTGRRGRAPSVGELADHFDVNKSAVFGHLRALLRGGFLEFRHGGYRLPGLSMVPVPVLGRVPAGAPREALEAPEGWLPCPAEWGRGRDLFALRVRGDSMTGAGILDGDTVVCARAETARDGEIVIALVDGEATVKRLARSAGALALVPANPRYKPITVRGDIRIAGKVLGVFRSLI
ncbi:MAG: transcriptional repressor LexA, partial [bacterium]